MADGFKSLLHHMNAQRAAEASPTRLDAGDARHIIAGVVRSMKQGTSAEDAYTTLLASVVEYPSALLHAHALGLCAERAEKGVNVSGDIGFHTRALTLINDNPQQIDSDALAASNTWPYWAAQAHASIRRRLAKSGFDAAAEAVRQSDIKLGLDGLSTAPSHSGPRKQRAVAFDNRRPKDGDLRLSATARRLAWD